MGGNAQETRKEECVIPWQMVCRYDLIADAVKKKKHLPSPHSLIPVFLSTLMPSTILSSLVSHVHLKQIRARGGWRFRPVIFAPGYEERFEFFGQPGLSCELLPTSKHCPKESSVIETQACVSLCAEPCKPDNLASVPQIQLRMERQNQLLEA